MSFKTSVLSVNKIINPSKSNVKVSNNLYFDIPFPIETIEEAPERINKPFTAIPNNQRIHFYNTKNVSKDTSEKHCDYNIINYKTFYNALFIARYIV